MRRWLGLVVVGLLLGCGAKKLAKGAAVVGVAARLPQHLPLTALLAAAALVVAVTAYGQMSRFQ